MPEFEPASVTHAELVFYFEEGVKIIPLGIRNIVYNMMIFPNKQNPCNYNGKIMFISNFLCFPLYPPELLFLRQLLLLMRFLSVFTLSF